MGCNCKKNKQDIDASIRVSDEGARYYAPNVIGKVTKFAAQAAIAVISVAIVAALAVPALLYIACCLAVGLEPSFRLKKINKRANARKQKL